MAKDIGIQLIDNNDQGTILDLKVQVFRNADGKITSGLVINNTLEQNKGMILLAHPGDFKLCQDIGVGIQDILFDHDYQVYRHRIREHFEKDGLSINKLDFFPNKPIIIDAIYSS
jgi:hypothetical protein